MAYRCEVTSIEGFVQQIACCYLPHGYRWYVIGRIPLHKDPELVDAKLIERYGLDISKRQRARQKERGIAAVQYLRHEHFFVLLATDGRHELFAHERGRVRDFRRRPLRFYDYSISFRSGGRTRTGEIDRRWHSHVQMAPEAYRTERAYFLDLALRKSVEDLCLEFRRVPFEPYAPVRRQLLNILRAVNARRKTAGMAPVPTTALCLRRRVVRPFERSESSSMSEPYSGEGPEDNGETVEIVPSPRSTGHRQPQLTLVVGRQQDSGFGKPPA
jgi:hypothetical protein